MPLYKFKGEKNKMAAYVNCMKLSDWLIVSYSSIQSSSILLTLPEYDKFI